MNKELQSKIKKIIDILWAGGVVNPIDYIEQISYLIYLKRYDEKLSDRNLKLKLLKRDSFLDDQLEKFRWRNWVVMSGNKLRDFLRDEVFPHMQGLFKKYPQAAEYFRGAVLKITDPNTLKQVVDILDTISFVGQGPDATGDLFEYMLTHLGTSSLNGQFRTPKQIRSFMVEMVDPDLDDTILDPACGTGGFLLDSFDHIKYKHSEKGIETPIYGSDWLETSSLDDNVLAKVQMSKSGYGDKISQRDFKRLINDGFTGYDVSDSMVKISMMNLMLNGLESINIRPGNTLSEYGGIDQKDLMKKYSIILANPPFAGQIQRDSIRNDIKIRSRKTEVLFLSVIMDMLAPGGRAAVIVPEGILFGTGTANKTIRQRLVNEFHLRAVISLHQGVFRPYAGVKTSVLVFDRPIEKIKKPTDYFIWFYDVKYDGYDPKKISQETRVEAPDRNDIPSLVKLWNDYKRSDFKEPPGIEGLSSLESGSEIPSNWHINRKIISENDYDLSANKYTPIIKEKILDEKPEELINKLIDIQSGIVKDLKELLNALK